MQNAIRNPIAIIILHTLHLGVTARLYMHTPRCNGPSRALLKNSNPLQAAGCACAKAPGPATVVVKHTCPCVQQQLHAIVAKRGLAIKSALRLVMRHAEVGARGRKRA